jgi:hypothetical protein
LNKKGDEEKVLQVALGKPVIKSAGNFAVIGDIGGKDIYVINGKELSWSRRIENRILNIDINEKGYVAVVHEVKGYKAGVTVFNPQGMERFTRTIAESFILSAKVLPSGRQLLINRVDTSQINANTDLEYNDISSEKPFSLWYLRKIPPS